MLALPARRALVALAATAALLPANPAVALASTATPTRTATSPQAPAPVARQIQVDRTLIDYGDTHLLTVTGVPGARAELFGNGRQIRSAALSSSGQYTWELKPGDRTLFSAKVDDQQTESATVEVRRTVTIGVSGNDGVYTFTGRIARAEPFVQVTIARLDPNTQRVTGVASTSTQADGSYTLRTRLPEGFASYYALTGVNRSLLQPGRSRPYGLVVPGATAAPSSAQSLTLGVVGIENDNYLFQGRLTPGRSAPVTLARLVDGQLVGVKGGRTSEDGGYLFSLQLASGTYFFTALTANARSRNYGLVVP